MFNLKFCSGDPLPAPTAWPGFEAAAAQLGGTSSPRVEPRRGESGRAEPGSGGRGVPWRWCPARCVHLLGPGPYK